jgi:FkbM family methyltransferase
VRLLRILKLTAVCVVTLVLLALVVNRPLAFALVSKAVGGYQPCPWPQLLRSPDATVDFAELRRQFATEITFVRDDDRLPIQLFRTKGRSFWIRKGGVGFDARTTLEYVLAEQACIVKYSGDAIVQPGDVVVDVGAHVGTFDDDALLRGAAKVILVEPDPINVECIRRNFSSEIAAGRVIVLPEGAWSSSSTMEFSTGMTNSGTGSFTDPEKGATKLSVRVRPLDDMLAGLGVERVDFIKMDIEGAEREALRGARQTLRRFQPLLLLDNYHRLDDSVVLPKVIRESNPRYQLLCPFCSPVNIDGQKSFLPHAIIFQ